MLFYALSRRRYDTVLYPQDPDNELGIPLYSEAMTPLGSGVKYRYTVRQADLEAASEVDSEFERMEGDFRREVRPGGTPLKCRRLKLPVVYLRRERWNGATFEADDEVDLWRHWRTRLALRLFSPDMPADAEVEIPAHYLLKLPVADGAEISGPSGLWNTVAASVVLGRDGKLSIQGTLGAGAPPLHPLPPDQMTFKGKAESGEDVACPTCFFSEAVTNPGASRAPTVKLVPLSVEIGSPGAGAPSLTMLLVRRVSLLWWPCKFSSVGRKIELQPLHGTLSKDYAAWISVEGLGSDVGGEAEIIGIAVARLLSVAHRARTPVVAVRRVWKNAEHTTVHENSWADTSNSLIPPSELKSFLEQTLPGYLAKNNSHRLFALTEYYVRSFIEDTADHKFTFASIFMEAFKFSWSVNDQAPDMIVDAKANGMVREFKRPPTAQEAAKDQLNGKTPQDRSWKFLELMNRYALQAAGPGGFTFIENRNALFHTELPAAAQTHGALGGTYPFLKPELERLQTQMEDIVLGIILGYSGRMYEYGSPDGEVAFPGRTAIP